MSIGNFYDWLHQTTQKTNPTPLIKIARLIFLQEIEIRKTMYLQFKLQIVGGASLTAKGSNTTFFRSLHSAWERGAEHLAMQLASGTKQTQRTM
jgi:hypothetical protein